MNNKKIQGYIMASIGFLLLLINALSYLLDGKIGKPALTIFGLIFVIIGFK